MDFYTEYFTMLNALANNETQLQNMGRYNVEPGRQVQRDVDMIIRDKKNTRIHIKDAIIRNSFNRYKQNTSKHHETETETNNRNSNKSKTSTNFFQTKNNEKGYKEYNGGDEDGTDTDELETVYI